MDIQSPDRVNWEINPEIDAHLFDSGEVIPHSDLVDEVLEFLEEYFKNDTILGNIGSFNEKLKSRDGTTFAAKLFDNEDLQFNLTTTMAPALDSVNKTIELHFDGLFFDQEAKSTHVKANTVFPKRVAGMNSNQIFVHESLLNSLFLTMQKQIFPIMITEQAAVGQILKLLPEIKQFYGVDADYSLGINFVP